MQSYLPVLSDHPIDPDVRARIMAELAAAERAHDVKVLYACESGNRERKTIRRFAKR